MNLQLNVKDLVNHCLRHTERDFRLGLDGENSVESRLGKAPPRKQTASHLHTVFPLFLNKYGFNTMLDECRFPFSNSAGVLTTRKPLTRPRQAASDRQVEAT